MDARPPLLIGALAAITASLCCIAPLVLVTLGVGGAWVANLSHFEPLRPVFVAISFAMLVLARRKLYRPAACESGTVCASIQRHRAALWVLSAFMLILLVFPWFAPHFY